MPTKRACFIAQGEAIVDELKRGQKEILESQLEVFENKSPQRDYEIIITNPEFTCLCPCSGYPDFATITLRYIPDEFCLELKSYKLFINKFRDRGIFHEEAVNEILEELVKVVKPRYMVVEGDFNPRGNVHTVVKAEYRSSEYKKNNQP
jgi:7-cyano-7-deazaguanine reductase